ncbi:NADH-quinone oxidoreductase subunit L [Demequina lignilytica]|uniref:NADH-quinone oxidoreductase subunit L n=1 Tax=Demequina lignilytica TaxID=3051663 RepID=A0AAW7M752_9MICO|nr:MULTISPECIES: NADH-quinone oxidoreductase subunit L [unclassified Demequina]MDN4478044.1 NADH-quinone oxidoreductase subunit L [Demequina sp. SYSU T00039-1]MDN4482877.1 NADH-quinone oxidoreductase subunit L [Demequina sp. SYSU T0a273]MDN4488506.1 NADH-quinone oxidoreductase subunit L [Demequina sp. SYSU T00039]MDN4489947.1 NADH-quinone oxidoreductase subunit L [Demequina sp. SYSU T00068]
MLDLTWLLIAVPLASSAVLLLAGRRADSWGHWLGVAASGSAFVVGLLALIQMLGLDAEERSHAVHLFSWIPGAELNLDAGLLVDPLSLTFVMLVTFVGTLIHVYSVAYMEHDPNRRIFFAYLNLFVAAMLLLVLADSYLLLFVGWEGVGLASYLLIGFWNFKPEYATAAKKAFVVNRIGDIGLILAMGLMFAYLGGVDFETVFANVDGVSTATLTAIGLTLLLAACGKSAQFPLQSWLGDAMAGPTPVSALIHAATMVTAGVYLLVRSAPILEGAPSAQTAIAAVGAFTLILGALIGMAKDDIKKALAASTMSQIGYMMLAAGLGPIGYAFAIFHLVTHGFFKAGMFLGAGSVMHGMGDQVDMRRFGALRTAMVTTWVTFGLGWLAILGIPPFSGFWSKDKIIEAAFVGEGAQPWILGGAALIGAGLTAFYMSRLFFMTFHGKARWTDGQHPHESPALMTVPMIILAVGSAFLGLFLAVGDRFSHWLEPVTGHAEHHEPVLPVPVLMAATLILVALGVWVAWRKYGAADVPEEAPAASLATIAARNDMFQDSVNRAVFERPGTHLTRTLVYADAAVVDGAVNGGGEAWSKTGEVARRLQTGQVRSYAATMLVGLVIVILVVVQGGL